MTVQDIKRYNTVMERVKTAKTNWLSRYSGMWVALIDDKVVAADKTISSLMSKVKLKRIKQRPVVFLVPRKEEGPYILLFL